MESTAETSSAKRSAWASLMSGWRQVGTGWPEARQQVRHLREEARRAPVYKMVDTCAAEFESYTPYLYSTYEEEDEAPPTDEEENHHSGQRAEPHRAGN